MEEIEILKTYVSDLRTIAARLVGLPVGVFRLTTTSGQELFDYHTLFDYEIEIGKILLSFSKATYHKAIINALSVSLTHI